VSIITLSTAKLHLRVDGSDEDVTIQIYLDAAEEISMQYLNRQVYATVEDMGSDETGIVINGPIKSAMLLQCGHLYANRESVSQVQGVTAYELPLGTKFLLDPYRLELGV
jgi:hypothetical protein